MDPLIGFRGGFRVEGLARTSESATSGQDFIARMQKGVALQFYIKNPFAVVGSDAKPRLQQAISSAIVPVFRV